MKSPTEETKEEFMGRYHSEWKGYNIFPKHKIALPCDCQDGGGPTHWAAVQRDAEFVALHLELYAPEGTPWPEEIPR